MTDNEGAAKCGELLRKTSLHFRAAHKEAGVGTEGRPPSVEIEDEAGLVARQTLGLEACKCATSKPPRCNLQGTSRTYEDENNVDRKCGLWGTIHAVSRMYLELKNNRK